ncbi:MAG: cell envelope integrity protein TolA [Candidatus Melainabacteria bacterium]|nr:MAG: cell envelope integrity protein TolA [Candidatus Melainabacteria bacterium]
MKYPKTLITARVKPKLLLSSLPLWLPPLVAATFLLWSPQISSSQQSTSNNDSVTNLQSQIKNEISQAKNHGVGTKPYEDALAAIEADQQISQHSEKIHQRYQSLLDKLRHQNHEATLLKRGVYKRLLSAEERNLGEYAPLMYAIKNKVKSRWHVVHSHKSNSVEVTFELKQNGQIQNLKLTKSSSNQEVDDAALEAIRKSVPFLPMPANLKFPDGTIWIAFRLDYNSDRSDN